jgi:hypothetical protein
MITTGDMAELVVETPDFVLTADARSLRIGETSYSRTKKQAAAFLVHYRAYRRGIALTGEAVGQ